MRFSLRLSLSISTDRQLLFMTYQKTTSGEMIWTSEKTTKIGYVLSVFGMMWTRINEYSPVYKIVWSVFAYVYSFLFLLKKYTLGNLNLNKLQWHQHECTSLRHCSTFNNSLSNISLFLSLSRSLTHTETQSDYIWVIKLIKNGCTHTVSVESDSSFHPLTC